MSSIPIQIAETIQTAHINQHPSPEHDINPSTAASIREPVVIASRKSTANESSYDAVGPEDLEDDIPVSVLKPAPRQRGPGQDFPPLPDLRFEQSYLHSIRGANTWWKVTWITVRDQVMMPFIQGIVWNVALFGWKHWNKHAKYSGGSAGARLRRWWFGVNNWPIPGQARTTRR